MDAPAELPPAASRASGAEADVGARRMTPREPKMRRAYSRLSEILAMILTRGTAPHCADDSRCAASDGTSAPATSGSSGNSAAHSREARCDRSCEAGVEVADRCGHLCCAMRIASAAACPRTNRRHQSTLPARKASSRPAGAPGG
eukprot:scaffold1311_cov121-Isochrysis_galbana.AAC.5